MNLDTRYIYGHCFSPVSVPVFDITKQREENRDVPCGRCYHCRISRINEWTTRMRLQSATYKNTYFVTLTISDDAPEQVLREHQACFSDCNTFHEVRYQPLVLSKSCVQKFIKRLRKYNNLPSLSYFLVGEYGHKYGRPHYHAILWCDEEISLDMLQNAWQLNGKPFGEIDFNDLVKNGTMTSNHVGHSFKYVCKYLQKKDFEFDKLPSFKFHLCLDFALYRLSTFKNQNTDEYQFFDREFFLDSPFNQEPPAGFRRALSPLYVTRFKPFMLCSRTHSIGGRYFAAHKARFQRGDLRLLGVLDKGLVFPSYFLRRAKQVVCPYFPTYIEDKKQGSVVSYKSTSCRLPSVASLLGKLQGTAGNIYTFDKDRCTSFRASLPVCRVEIADTDTGEIKGNYNLCELTIYDKDTHSYLVYNGTYFDRYSYDRSSRSFEVVGSEPLESLLSKMDDSFKKLLKFVHPFDVQRAMRQDELDAYIQSEYAGSYEQFERDRKNIENQLLGCVADRQAKYNNTKILF